MSVYRLPPHLLTLLASKIHRTCHLCAEPLSGNWHSPLVSSLVCKVCASHCERLPVLDMQGIPLLVGGFYEMPLSQAMSAYKDHENLSSLMVLYHLLANIPKPRGLTRALIVPVPTTPKRLGKRGFYPVLTLAKCLSYLWQIPLWQGIARHENTTHQRGLHKSARLLNVNDDFYLTKPLSAYQVVLFDDVVTTGATLMAMANTIKANYPKVKPIAVSVLHGKAELHLPVWSTKKTG